MRGPERGDGDDDGDDDERTRRARRLNKARKVENKARKVETDGGRGGKKTAELQTSPKGVTHLALANLPVVGHAPSCILRLVPAEAHVRQHGVGGGMAGAQGPPRVPKVEEDEMIVTPPPPVCGVAPLPWGMEGARLMEADGRGWRRMEADKGTFTP